METKLFIGSPLTADLVEIIEEEGDSHFMRIPYQGKEYLGIYLEETGIADIRVAALPFSRLNLEPQDLVLFPQLLLG